MGEFTLYWWDRDGGQHRELVLVSAQRAAERAFSLANGPASKLGIISRIMITDCGDSCVFEWTHDAGIIFPPVSPPVLSNPDPQDPLP